ncbi:GerAB/ArcD/ProY family transporter [Paenibacillus chitinolyticus]|uniref:GerAB/ArcD/ProY family transporter n=1 Tax=Paenibacillus chitinolyticus TaxID=79263 RepID=UPI002DB97545|nr:GerAB/ArcD/ProY family transporter [Paenibacillus chitinolyticus]MEC0248910.1 GerAB/ArcD/ProY family transporter [Paenibacillus chitinolyticus]
MTHNSNNISLKQMLFLILQTQIGVQVLFLPSRIQAIAKGDAWMSVLLAGLFSQMLILMMWALNKRFPTATLYDFMPRLTGKAAAVLLQVLYVVYFTAQSSLVLMLFYEVIRDWVFPETPKWLITGLMVLVCIYLTQENLQIIARFFLLVSSLFLVMIFISAYAYTHSNLLYIFPIGQAGFLPVVRGAHEAVNTLSGYEWILFCYSFVEGPPRKKLAAASAANAFSTLLYTFLVFTSLVVFSPSELPLLPHPVLYMVKALTFTIIERPDLYFLSAWIVVVATSIMAYLYLASTGISQLFGLSSHRKPVLFIAVALMAIALLIHDQAVIRILGRIVSLSSYAFLAGIPLLLLLISLVFHIREGGRRLTE